MTGCRCWLAWAAWALVHILKLAGFRNRLSVLLNWMYNYFTYDRGPRIVLTTFPETDDLDAERRAVLTTAPTSPGPDGSRSPALAESPDS